MLATVGLIAIVALTVLVIAHIQERNDIEKKREREARRPPNEMRKRFARLKQNRLS